MVLNILKNEKADKMNKILISEDFYEILKPILINQIKINKLEYRIVNIVKLNEDELEDCSALFIAHPNQEGAFEVDQLESIWSKLKERCIWTVSLENILLNYIYMTPGERDIDIAIGSLQPLGIPNNFQY